MYDINERIELRNCTVGDIIDWLQKFSRDTKVYVNGDYYGFIHVEKDKTAISFDDASLEEEYECDDIQGLSRANAFSLRCYVSIIVQNALRNNDYTDVEIVDVQPYGSRTRGEAVESSDLDIVVEYRGDIKEDELFNLLHEKEHYVDDILLDINPITECKSGTMKEFLSKPEVKDFHRCMKQ